MLLIVLVINLLPSLAEAQPSKTAWQTEWERVVEAGKKEGKVVVSIPASAELRKEIERVFKPRFGIDVEIVPARGAAIVRRIVDENKAEIFHFDVHIGGSLSAVTGLLSEGVLEPVEPWLILPDVKDPKNWWGGHMWVDRSRRYIYAFQAYLTESM